MLVPGRQQRQQRLVNEHLAIIAESPDDFPQNDRLTKCGFPQVQLRTPETFEYELDSLGIDHSTEFNINLTFNGTEPRILLGAGRNLTWTKQQHANGSWTVSINATPASTQGLFPAPSTWDGTRQANSRFNETVQLALDSLSGFTSERKDDLDGAIFGTDSQAFATPEYDPTTNSVSVSVAAPHFTVNGANNTGFFETFLPRDLLDTWGRKGRRELVGESDRA